MVPPPPHAHDHLEGSAAPLVAAPLDGEVDISEEPTVVDEATHQVLTTGHKHAEEPGVRQKDHFEDEGHVQAVASFGVPMESEEFTHVFDTRFDGLRTKSDMAGGGCVSTKDVPPVFPNAVAVNAPGEQPETWTPKEPTPTTQMKWRHGNWVESAEM